jgi:hypothetical protein
MQNGVGQVKLSPITFYLVVSEISGMPTGGAQSVVVSHAAVLIMTLL